MILHFYLHIVLYIRSKVSEWADRWTLTNWGTMRTLVEMNRKPWSCIFFRTCIIEAQTHTKTLLFYDGIQPKLIRIELL